MAHPLEEIVIEGFKSIEKVELRIGAINLLVGANGAGKSNFVGAFGLLHDMMDGQLQVHVARRGGASALLHFGPKHTPALSVRLKFGPNGYAAKLGYAAGDQLFFESEECWFDKTLTPGRKEVDLGSGHKESALPDTPDNVASYVLTNVRSWKVYHFHDTSETARVKQKHAVGDNAALRPDASNLAAFLLRLQQTDPLSYRRIVGSVRLVAPFFDDFVLRPDPVRPDQIQLEWRERDSDAYFNAHALSDGTLRFICLSTLLLQPKLPTAILIDEPELGLHPFAINQLAALIKSASKRSQVIASTQSVTLMNQFEPDDIVVVDRNGRASDFRRVSRDEVSSWADSYSLGEIWEKNVIGGRPG